MNAPIFDDDYIGPRWRYGLTNRPVAGCHLPKGWIIGSYRPSETFRVFGTIDFPREMTGEEVDGFELEVAGNVERRLAAQDALIQAIQGLAPWVSKAGESGAFEGCARPDGWKVAFENAMAAFRAAVPEALP